MKKDIRLAAFLALSVVLSLIESFIPIINGSFFGIKVGISNVVFIYILYKYSYKEAIFLSVLRVILVGMIRTGIFNTTFFFSLSGALVSMTMMFLFKKITKLSIIGISIIGSISHMMTQLFCTFLFIENFNILYIMPLILVSSCITGIITGIISKMLIEKI